jgi:uncharacterized protein DUF2721
MTSETVARTIQTILAPVVMVTTCSIMLGGLLSHYAAINDRLRTMAHERLELLRAIGWKTAPSADVDAFTSERMSEIDAQMPELLRRHKLVRDAVLMVYSAILIFVANMFVIALAAALNSEAISTAALVIFLFGTAILFVGVLFTIVEIRQSHRAIAYEARRVLDLGR